MFIKNIVNLTPHEINFFMGEEKKISVQPSGTVARAKTSRQAIGSIELDGIELPINKTEFGSVEGLPDPEHGTIFIVSAIVAKAVPDRDDIFIVDDAVRDNLGRIIGARAIARV